MQVAEADTQLQLPRRALRTTAALCWIGWIFDFYDLILVSFLITDIERTLHIDFREGSWLLGVGLGASGLGGVIFGWLADRVGRRKVLTWTVLLFSVGMFAAGLAQNTTWFLIARFVTGLGLGGEWAVGHALLAESVEPGTRGRWSAWLQSGEPVGVAIAAVVGFVVAPRIGWRATFIISSSTGLLALLFRRHLSESPLWDRAHALAEGARAPAPSGAFLRTYAKLMVLAWVLAVFKLGTYWTCYTWLPRFIKESIGVALGGSALWILLGQLGQFFGMHLFGQVADRVGRRMAFTVFSAITAAALLPLALAWDPLFHQHRAAFWALILLLGLGSGCTAGFGALLAEIFPTARRTLAMGAVYNLARGVQLFAPVVVAYAVASGGLRAGLLVPTALAFATGTWVWVLPDRARARLDARS